MHGLALHAVQLFVCDCYGQAKWSGVMDETQFGFTEFESMLDYDSETALVTLSAIETVLDRPLPEILEDLGTYLVSHPTVEALRRLLRFSGVSFEEFLHSLDDLPDRARLAVADLELPQIELRQHSSFHYSLICSSRMPGWGHVLMGILRTMADDYGALAMVEHRGGGQGTETLAITLLETSFAEGRDFDLGARSA
ncbi:MAG: heme NO-binding domain-containing protein [Aliishimia sp.]